MMVTMKTSTSLNGFDLVLRLIDCLVLVQSPAFHFKSRSVFVQFFIKKKSFNKNLQPWFVVDLEDLILFFIRIVGV